MHGPKNEGFKLHVPQWEFIALAAALMALNALAIDIMLPGLQEIGASLGVSDENHRQYVISAYIFGLGLPQLLYGPVSDRFGRRVPLLFGLAVYVIAALCSAFSPGFELLLVLRFVQGIGAAAIRVVIVSVVRDVFGGNAMAEAMSLILMVFMIVPVVAPAMGQVIMLFFEWQMIFIFMAVVALVIAFWTFRRLPETLPPSSRRPLTGNSIRDGLRTVLGNRTAFFYTLATAFLSGGLFGFIISAQQIYVEVYDLGVWFPALFAMLAGSMALSSFVNARLVRRIGMRPLSHGALIGFASVTALSFALALAGPMHLAVFVSLFTIAMLQYGLIASNFNAIAMEPLGRLAGTASAVLGFAQTVGGAAIGSIIGQCFDGSVLPFNAGLFLVALTTLGLVMIAERGRLFHTKAHH